MSQQPRIERVMNGNFFPRYAGEDPAEYWKKVDTLAEQMKRAGFTHVIVNDAPVSVLQVMDPENSYLRFTTYGHSLDKFVASSLNEGIFHPSILELNRSHLLWQAKLAKKYGFRCWVRCTEMTLMPESFFLRHPQLRGPRVDNPACSTSPRYALCPMMPEVQKHYRELVTGLLELCPEIDEMHIFTCDSGGGFCYAEHLYSGANGAWDCRKIPAGKQAQMFCRTLLEAGRKVNPEFRVVMTSSLNPHERIDLLEGAPEGLAASIFGAFAWGGGLEDHWGNMAVGPEIHQPKVRAAARQWAEDDMRTRAETVTSRGGILYASYNPDYYGGPSDAPRPFETHEVMMKYLRWGVRNIIGGAPGGKMHANGAIFTQACEDGPMETDAAVHKLAQKWVGPKLADRLCEVWRLSDFADREWPMPAYGGHAFYVQPLLMTGPIIPDESRLGPDDLSYFLTSVVRDETKMRTLHGGPWRFMHYRDEIKRYVIDQLEKVVFAADDKALALLEAMLAEKGLTSEQRECLTIQRREIGIHRCFMQRVSNWFRASFHVLEGSTPYPGLPSMGAIIQDEIDASQRWHEYEGGTGRLESPRQKLMIAHRDDPPRRIDLREHAYHEYLGLDHWPGAHRAPRK